MIPARVAISNSIEARDGMVLKANEIEAILSLDGALKDIDLTPHGVKEVEIVLLADGPNRLDIFLRAVRTLEQLYGSHRRVLVQCHAGRSRSPAVVAAFLARFRQIRPDDALKEVMSLRDCSIAPELQTLVRRSRYAG